MMPSPFPISSNYSIPVGDGPQWTFLAVTTGSSTITVTLPALATGPGPDEWSVTVRKVDAGGGVVKLVTSDGSTIDGVTGTAGITTPAAQHAGFTVEPGAGNWWVTGL